MASVIITIQDSRSDDDLPEDDIVKVTVEADPPLALTGGGTGAQRAAVRMLNHLHTAFREIVAIHVEDDEGGAVTIDPTRDVPADDHLPGCPLLDPETSAHPATRGLTCDCAQRRTEN